MESLALAAAVVVLSIVILSAASVALSFTSLRLLSFAVGLVTVFSGGWLLSTLPHAWIMGGVVVVCGVVGMWRGWR